MRNRTDPSRTISTYVVLTLAFSSVFWYQLIMTPTVAENAPVLFRYTFGLMWCPAVAAIVTRLIYQRNLKGFGLWPGRPKWLIIGMLLPIAVGLLMFGSAWLSGIAPFNANNATTIFSPIFIPALLYGLAFNCLAACGEELGWRGFLVPELWGCMGFTELALVSGAIWTVWHFPLIIFGNYHGSGTTLFSLAVFVPFVIGFGLILAWLRIASGSVWVAVLYHGFWNYFIQKFYPALTVKTDSGDMMLGEFGWFVTLVYIALALVFWYFRDRLPSLPAA